MLPYSRTTISDALRGTGSVNPATAKCIRDAAIAAGYQYNPLAGAVMSEIRRSHVANFRGTIAAVRLEDALRPDPRNTFSNAQIRGARERSAQLGYNVEYFGVGPGSGVPLKRLDSILKSRGIHGVIILPAWTNPDFTGLDWSRLAGVYTDYIIKRPALNSICPNHPRSMHLAMTELHQRGYRRPGLFLRTQLDDRLQHIWEGALVAFQRHSSGVAAIPGYFAAQITRESFLQWFQRHKPDVVIGHDFDAIAWMEAAGARVPQTHGFFALNLARAPWKCAGLDLMPYLIGTRAAELVIAQLQRNEYGIPTHPSLTTITGQWVEGPTIREAAFPGSATLPAPAKKRVRVARGTPPPVNLSASAIA